MTSVDLKKQTATKTECVMESRMNCLGLMWHREDVEATRKDYPWLFRATQGILDEDKKDLPYMKDIVAHPADLYQWVDG